MCVDYGLGEMCVCVCVCVDYGLGEVCVFTMGLVRCICSNSEFSSDTKGYILV